MRVRVYVDALNLFYGALKGHPERKWLDVVALADALVPDDTVDLVRYFSAHVHGKVDPAHPQRQEAYLRALAVNPRFAGTMGRFRHPVRDLPLAAPPPGGPVTVSVIKSEEKGSDVNLATWLLVDGVDRLYDVAVVISNDSDLVEPIRVANERYGPVHVVSPYPRPSNDLRAASASYRWLDPEILLACQLPDKVQVRNGRSVTRPDAWRP